MINYDKIILDLTFGSAYKQMDNNLMYNGAESQLLNESKILSDAEICSLAADFNDDEEKLMKVCSMLNGYSYIPFGNAGYQKYNEILSGKIQDYRRQKMIEMLTISNIDVNNEMLTIVNSLCDKYEDTEQDLDPIGLINTITKIYSNIEEMVESQEMNVNTAKVTLQMLVSRVEEMCTQNKTLDISEIFRDLKIPTKQLNNEQIAFIQKDLEKNREKHK
jgi:hypothetical protein